MGIAQTLAARIMEMNGKIVGYQEEIRKWVQRGEDAIKSHDLSFFDSMLGEMQKLVVDGRAAVKKEEG